MQTQGNEMGYQTTGSQKEIEPIEQFEPVTVIRLRSIATVF